MPAAAGGTVDSMARMLAEAMRPKLGVVVVENKAGAAGLIGTKYVQNGPSDGRTLLSAGGDGLIFLWNAADARVLLRLGGARGRWYQAATLSPDGQRILAADAEGVLHIWDTSTGEVLLHLASDRGEITDLRLLADGQRILTASASGRASEWSFPSSIAATATIPGPTTAADHLGDRLAPTTRPLVQLAPTPTSPFD